MDVMLFLNPLVIPKAMQDYIPFRLIDSAACELIAESSKYWKESIDHDQVEILQETIHLKEPHSLIPTLYKIVIRYPNGNGEKRSMFGVWTATGQRIQLQ